MKNGVQALKEYTLSFAKRVWHERSYASTYDQTRPYNVVHTHGTLGTVLFSVNSHVFGPHKLCPDNIEYFSLIPKICIFLTVDVCACLCACMWWQLLAKNHIILTYRYSSYWNMNAKLYGTNPSGEFKSMASSNVSMVRGGKWEPNKRKNNHALTPAQIW